MQMHGMYVYETGLNLHCKRVYGRARHDERVNRVVGGQRGANVTIIIAISDLIVVLHSKVH